LTRSPLGCHVSVDVKVTSVSQSALVSICVRRYQAYNRIIECVMFWELLQSETV